MKKVRMKERSQEKIIMRYKFLALKYLVLSVSMRGCAGAEVTQFLRTKLISDISSGYSLELGRLSQVIGP
jgi:hypothetical protein